MLFQRRNARLQVLEARRDLFQHGGEIIARILHKDSRPFSVPF
jgi:hypothetical protein